MRVGLIGYGSIGQHVARRILDGSAGEAALVGVLVRRARPRAIGSPIFLDVKDLIAQSPEIVIEAASPEAVMAHADAIVEHGISMVLASGAALMDSAFRDRLARACTRSSSRVYVPAGALAGLDALQATAGHLDRVTLRVIEPHASGRILFSGSAAEAVQRFPNRLNVAAAAQLACGATMDVELSQGQVREIELTAHGDFGELVARTRPTPLMVALSLLATLRRLQQPIVVG
jgi:aspartate dehydrogenase